ncbi:MAG: AbrB/MazE/SpoVT family DNA-binding domain-containing protein [Proteobacteria bacterium]|nr:AbrB/MazE/SpoVT family DNA-binding domain-containing protein [Pseudomonadota bacterium]
MRQTKSWTTQVKDAEDGSGDVIVELPKELLTQLGWQVGDTLEMTIDEARRIWLRKRVD